MSDAGRRQLDPVFGSDKERAAFGDDFLPLVQSPGWERLITLLELHVRNIGLTSLRDSKDQHDYWQGRLDEVEQLLAEVTMLAAERQKDEEVDEDVVRAFVGRSGGAGLGLRSDPEDEAEDEG